MRDSVLRFIERHPACGIRDRDAHKWRPLDCSPDDRAFYTHKTFAHWGAIHAGMGITNGEHVFAVDMAGNFIECCLENLERNLFPIEARAFFPSNTTEDDSVDRPRTSSRLARAIRDIEQFL